MYWYAKKISGCSIASTWLISRLRLFGCFFEEIKFIAKSRSPIQVHGKKVHGIRAKISCILYAQQFFVPPFDMSSQHKCEQQLEIL